MNRLSQFLVVLCLNFGLVSICWSQTTDAAAAPPTFAQLFELGGKAYQTKDYAAAKTAFEQALQLEPRSEHALTNLALTEFQLGQKGRALGALRRALQLNPEFSTSRAALAFIEKQLPVKEIPHEIQWFEKFRESFLNYFSLNIFLAMTALFLLSAGWLGLRYFSERKSAIEEERPLPKASFTWSLSVLGLILFSTVTAMKAFDEVKSRGTIVLEKVPVKSSPDQNSPDLFDLYEGLEVIIEQNREAWIQVTYPGALSGWIPSESLFSHEVK
jgi:tetratricopeptide (TPR) repeat protein